MLREWEVYEDVAADDFAALCNIPVILAKILLHRNIDTPEAVKKFLYPEIYQEYYDPFLLTDMKAAVCRIQKALDMGEQITVYGDYDVDGITATCLLVRNLRVLGGKVDYFIPSRSEGYGLHEVDLRNIAQNGTTLVITVDCGILGNEAVAALSELDIIVTDHHLPGSALPQALAVIDPHRADSAYPYRNLAGVGVAFKLLQALWREIKGEEFLGDLELVALGTVADIVPLLDENRKIVKAGLSTLGNTEIFGLKALLEVANLLGRPLNAGHIAFGLAPRLNAAGRMGSAMDAVRLLLTEDNDEAEERSAELNNLNVHRQDVEQNVLAAAEEELDQNPPEHAIVVSGQNWHPGVIGIVASRLVDKYYMPTVVITEGENDCRGSCRSIPGFNMCEALKELKEYLVAYGGHEQAAGLTIEREKIAPFREAFAAWAAKHLTEEDCAPKEKIEMIINPFDLDLDTVREMERLAPYGTGNPKPLFGAKNIIPVEPRVLGAGGKHLKFTICSKDKSMAALLWNKSSYLSLCSEPLDIIFSPELNEWQGTTSVQCIVESMLPNKAHELFPDREFMVNLYKLLKSLSLSAGAIVENQAGLAQKYNQRYGAVSPYTIDCGLKILMELKLLKEDHKKANYYLARNPKRCELTRSALWRRAEAKRL